MMRAGGRTTHMRIRTYRAGDIPILMHVQQIAAAFDGLALMNEADFAFLLEHSFRRNSYNVFLLTDDDDEFNTWGQGESLDGLQGEVVGYTILQLSKDACGYHFHCHGTILPAFRGLGAGHGLLLCALNHARIQTIDFIAEARQRGTPIYFEVPLPDNDPAAEHLASDFELTKTGTRIQERLVLYRTEL